MGKGVDEMKGDPWIIAVDLDGTLCKRTSSDKYPVAEPIRENILKINRLHDLGHDIVIHTARGWFKYKETGEWLRKNGVKYSRLVMGKLFAHAYIDDMNYTMDEILKKMEERVI